MSEQVKADLKRLFQILKSQEETDEGRVFHPVTISCCRALLGEELIRLLGRLEKYAND